MLNLIIWVVAGALIGWAASIILQTNNRHGLVADILVGIVGAFLGGYFLSPLFNVDTINEGDFSIPALLVSLGGAVLVLLFTKLFRSMLGYMTFVLVAMGLFIYFDCWTLASPYGFCSSVKALPFLP